MCVSKCVGAQLNMADSVVGFEEAAVLPHVEINERGIKNNIINKNSFCRIAFFILGTQ